MALVLGEASGPPESLSIGEKLLDYEMDNLDNLDKFKIDHSHNIIK